MILALLLALRRVGVVWISSPSAIRQVSTAELGYHIHSPLLLTGCGSCGIWVGALSGLVLRIIWDTFCTSPA